MCMIATVEARQQLRPMVRIAKHAIEVDNTVELTSRTNPLIDLLALCLPCQRKHGERGSRQKKPFQRVEGAGKDFQSLRMRPLDELSLALLDLLDRNVLGRIQREDIIDAQLNN